MSINLLEVIFGTILKMVKFRPFNNIDIQNMIGVESTPSVDFQFEDAFTSRPNTRMPPQETEVKYEFSCTNDKKITHFSHSKPPSHFDLSRQPQVNTPYEGDSINTEDFFQDFESKFVVTFDDVSQRLSSSTSKSLTKPSENKQNSSTFQNKELDIFEPIRLSLPADSKEDNLCRINQLKSDIIGANHKNSHHPIFAIKKKNEGKKKEKKIEGIKSDKITKKKQTNGEIIKFNFPQTCRHFQENLWNSNPAMGGSQIFKRLHKRSKIKISPFRVRQTSLLEKSLQSTNDNLKVKGKSKPFSKYKIQNKIEKSNIFVKLPCLR